MVQQPAAPAQKLLRAALRKNFQALVLTGFMEGQRSACCTGPRSLLEAGCGCCLQGLCGEQLLRGWLRAWALDDGLHAFVRVEGYGWLSAQELHEVAARWGTTRLESR